MQSRPSSAPDERPEEHELPSEAPVLVAASAESNDELTQALTTSLQTRATTSELGDDGTSVLTELDLELQSVTEGTSILADADLEFTSGNVGSEPTKSSRDYSMLDPRSLLLGRAFGGFKIVRELASGGMASVFLARKDGPGRVSQHAAIKVVHPHLACQSGFVDMFLDEARIVSCVHHPNMCRVLDFGQAEGTYYLAMEYVLGETWGALQTALANDETGKAALPAISAYVIAQAAEGLHAAHEASDDQGDSLHIVHRDVSPQNIFVAYDGTVRVLDFGIARAADRITSTQVGTVKGRLAYMAPEQMEGKPLDRRADIWSLGVVLREALENRRLFRKGSDAETMLAVTSEPLPAWHGTSSPKLREVVDKALERELAQRYLTAHHLSGDLIRFCRAQASPVAMPEVSAWMNRLFKHRLEEKRQMLQERAPEPRTGDTGPLGEPWRSAPSTQGFTPSAGTGTSRSREHSYSSSTQGTQPERPASVAAQGPTSRWLASGLLFAVVAGGAGAGVWFARHGANTQFAETKLAAGPVAAPELAETSKGAPTEASAPLPSAITEVVPTEQAESPSLTNAGVTAGAEASATAPPSSATPTEEPREASKHGKSSRQRKGDGTSSADTKVDGTPTAPTEPRAAASPPVQGPPGTVLVAYLGGWAEVYLGNKLLGTTPGRFSVPSGKQTLTIKPFGTGTPEQRTVDVPAGGSTKLSITQAP